jgi:hypothetical protein
VLPAFLLLHPGGMEECSARAHCSTAPDIHQFLSCVRQHIHTATKCCRCPTMLLACIIRTTSDKDNNLVQKPGLANNIALAEGFNRNGITSESAKQLLAIRYTLTWHTARWSRLFESRQTSHSVMLTFRLGLEMGHFIGDTVGKSCIWRKPGATVVECDCVAGVPANLERWKAAVGHKSAAFREPSEAAESARWQPDMASLIILFHDKVTIPSERYAVWLFQAQHSSDQSMCIFSIATACAYPCLFYNGNSNNNLGQSQYNAINAVYQMNRNWKEFSKKIPDLFGINADIYHNNIVPSASSQISLICRWNMPIFHSKG